MHGPRQIFLSCHRSNRWQGVLLLFFLAAYGGLQAQVPPQLSLTGPSVVRLGGEAQYTALVGGEPTAVVWSVDGSAGGTGSTGQITASGVFSPASTIFAGHSVTISATTQVSPASSASMKVKVLNPLPHLTSGSAIQTVPGGTFLLNISGNGFVSGSQLQVAGADVATVFVSSGELQSTVSLSAGTTTINVGVLNPNAEQKSPVTRMLPIQAAAASAALSGFTCGNLSITGSGSDVCTVTLTQAAASGGLSVSLTSSNAAITVPGTVLVPANGTSTGFVANAAPVTSAQTVVLTATGGGVAESLTLQLNASVPTLNISPASVAFGNIPPDTPSTQPVTLTSTGTAPVIINSAVLSWTGFTMSGATFPVTLNPGLAIALEVQFDPMTPGPLTGQLTVQSNSSTNGTVVIGLTGTGGPHQVTLTWDAPSSSPDPVAGYNVYRSAGAGAAYQLLNSSVDAQTTYVDSAVQPGLTYNYIVESVDNAGMESVPSNQATASVP
jgi:hypothetical protein